VKDLAGKTAVVTGASRGIGAEVAALLEQAGARVVGLARSLTPRQSETRWDIPCDLTDLPELQASTGRILDDWGTPDIVVNNAGAFLLRPFESTEVDELDRQYAVNVRAPFAVARAFLPRMRRAGRGILVTVGSVSDHTPLPDNSAYASTKCAVRGLHEALVAEYRGSGVRLGLVSPGPTDTAAWDAIDPDTKPGFLPRAEMLRPLDVAEAIMFVISRPVNVQVDWLRLGPAPVSASP
jgi:NAD(P)-dependent dehydrogenase (short-subunit alcohol dehydrogenase family)